MKRIKFSTLAAVASLALYGGQSAYAGCMAIPGNQASPFQASQPNPNNGFAEYVMDANNLALELCLDPVNCFFDPVAAGNLFSEQIGFGAEAFWWLAESNIDTPVGLSAIIVLAAEAAFATEEPANGDQFPFTRLRIRLDVPAPGVYTVTHPYGTEEFTVAAVGAGQEVRTSADISFVTGPAGGTSQNQGCVAPWLQWDPTESSPPAGFIGDGATPHRVTGSPTGNNFFLISAVDLSGNPIDLDGAGNSTVSTDLFTVSGKLYDGTLATPMISSRTTYERDATASAGQVDVFATAAKFASVSFNGGPNLPAGDIPLISDPADPRVSDADSSKFYASTLLTPDATLVPSVVELTATDTTTDPTRLLRLVTDLVTITRAEYNTANNTLTVTATSSDANLTPALMVAEYGVAVPAEIVTAAPPATVNVTSAVGGTDEAHVTVVDNTPPLANNDSTTTDENVEVTINVVANDTDADGINPATVTIVSTTTNGLAINNGDGTIRYIPFANFNGSDSLTYRVADNTGVVSNVATVSITVNPVNNTPVAAADSATTDNQTPVTINVLDNDSDADGDTLTVTAVTVPANGTAVINADHTVTYTPAAVFTGTDSFSYTVSDGNGGSATATVSVQVFEVNSAPTAADDIFTVDEDSGANILNVLVNDTDPEGDTLTITAVTQPVSATVVNNGTSVSYTPAVNFNGSTSFTYTIDDGNGNSATANVTVNVTAVNDNPVAFGNTATTTTGTPVNINVLANDFDVDGDTLTVTAATIPANGTTMIEVDSTITYTADADFSGIDTFVYTASDGNGGSATATVTVDVSAVAGLVDLDITALRATGQVRGVGTVDISLAIRLGGAVNEPRPATIIGENQAGAEIYRQTLNVDDAPGRGSTSFDFPSYTTNGNEGTITWTATLVDDDPDIDQLTDTTRVR